MQRAADKSRSIHVRGISRRSSVALFTIGLSLLDSHFALARAARHSFESLQQERDGGDSAHSVTRKRRNIFMTPFLKRLSVFAHPRSPVAAAQCSAVLCWSSGFSHLGSAPELTPRNQNKTAGQQGNKANGEKGRGRQRCKACVRGYWVTFIPPSWCMISLRPPHPFIYPNIARYTTHPLSFTVSADHLAQWICCTRST